METTTEQAVTAEVEQLERETFARVISERILSGEWRVLMVGQPEEKIDAALRASGFDVQRLGIVVYER